MSTEDQIRELLDALCYPPGDVRREIGDLAIELAQAIDGGEGWNRGEWHSPSWLLGYVLEDLTGHPNDPPNYLNEIRLRCARRWWEDGQEYAMDATRGSKCKSGRTVDNQTKEKMT